MIWIRQGVIRYWCGSPKNNPEPTLQCRSIRMDFHLVNYILIRRSINIKHQKQENWRFTEYNQIGITHSYLFISSTYTDRRTWGRVGVGRSSFFFGGCGGVSGMLCLRRGPGEGEGRRDPLGTRVVVRLVPGREGGPITSSVCVQRHT